MKEKINIGLLNDDQKQALLGGGCRYNYGSQNAKPFRHHPSIKGE